MRRAPPARCPAAARRCARQDPHPGKPARRLSVSRAFSSALTSTPQLLANAVAACVGVPCTSNAALTGGPRRSSGRSGCCAIRRRTRTASRRGVANRSTARCSSPAFDSPQATPSPNAVLRLSSDFGGSSSVPISTRKSRWALMRGPRSSGHARAMADRRACRRHSIPRTSCPAAAWENREPRGSRNTHRQPRAPVCAPAGCSAAVR